MNQYLAGSTSIFASVVMFEHNAKLLGNRSKSKASFGQVAPSASRYQSGVKPSDFGQWNLVP
jgi:hypothetical protein